jgi:ABC-type proline/glycine betaine transport system substrate-binding protein
MSKKLFEKWHTFTFTAACLLIAFSGSLWATTLKIALIDTPDSITKAYMLKHILEAKTDHNVDLVNSSVESMWQGITTGELDASFSVILPEQQAQFEQYKNLIEDLGPNWIGKTITVHTIVRKGLTEKDITVVRFLNNYCLCGERLNSAKNLLKNKMISRTDAMLWMEENKPWLHNMMGFARPYADREARNVTY